MSLSDQELRVLLLRFREGKSLFDTAQIMRVPITSVLSITESAFDKLEAQAVAA
jgi:DNA-directed RNA polymerase specialized sigma24 family protein